MTDKDKKLILEWCGWYTKRHSRGWLMWYSPTLGFMGNEPPDLDFNFYFKYAVPKLIEQGYEIIVRWLEDEWEIILFAGKQPFKDSEIKTKEDPAEAFGQALLKLIRGE